MDRSEFRKELQLGDSDYRKRQTLGILLAVRLFTLQHFYKVYEQTLLLNIRRIGNWAE